MEYIYILYVFPKNNTVLQWKQAAAHIRSYTWVLVWRSFFVVVVLSCSFFFLRFYVSCVIFFHSSNSRLIIYYNLQFSSLNIIFDVMEWEINGLPLKDEKQLVMGLNNMLNINTTENWPFKSSTHRLYEKLPNDVLFYTVVIAYQKG